MEENKVIKDEDIVSSVVKRDRRIGADKAVTNKEEEFSEEEEYINSENDPCSVEEINDDYVIIEEEEESDFDEIFETVRTKITNLTNYDQMMEKKVLDSLKRGTIK